jgi:hypothetical protein
MFRNSPSPYCEVDVSFDSPLLALGAAKALSGDERRRGPLSSLISWLSAAVVMVQIGIDWKEMFHNSPSPDCEADVCFASPSSALVAMQARVLVAAKALSDNERRWGSLSSPISGLSTTTVMGQIGIDWQEMFRNSPSLDREADVCFASPSSALGTAKVLSGDERRQGPLSSLISWLLAVAAMVQIVIDWKEMFHNPPFPDCGADVCFASPSSAFVATQARVLVAAKALLDDKWWWGSLSSPISGLSTTAVMGLIGIDWQEMFRNSASPRPRGRRLLRLPLVGFGHIEGVIGRRAVTGSSFHPDLRIIGGGDWKGIRLTPIS